MWNEALPSKLTASPAPTIEGTAEHTAAGPSSKIVGDRMITAYEVASGPFQYPLPPLQLPSPICREMSSRAAPVGAVPPAPGSLRYQSKARLGSDGSSLIITTGSATRLPLESVSTASRNALAIAYSEYMFVLPHVGSNRCQFALIARARNRTPAWNRTSLSVVAFGSFLTPSKSICTKPEGVVDMPLDQTGLESV